MNVKRTAALAAVGGALAIWLAAAATSGGRTSNAPLTLTPPPIDAHGAKLAEEIERLHERLRPAATPRVPGRDLFSFVRSHQHAVPTLATSIPSVEPSAPPVQTFLKLTGIAEDEAGEGTVRTAIISGLGQLFLVKEGESVAGRFDVIKISPEVVELSDRADGRVVRLALK